jgi:hypothetical protein
MNVHRRAETQDQTGFLRAALRVFLGSPFSTCFVLSGLVLEGWLQRGRFDSTVDGVDVQVVGAGAVTFTPHSVRSHATARVQSKVR